MPNQLTYFICGTPRTGSTLLCSLLTSTGIAGRPESYFREPDETSWATRWGIRHDGAVDFTAFLRAAIAAGSTPNGVLGVRAMWGTMDQIVAKLTTLYGTDTDDGRELLERAFGPRLRFVYLNREDEIGQAVSWARAEQTGYWQRGDEAVAAPHYDFGEIDTLVRTIADHNHAWRAWFERFGIDAYDVSYEKLSSDPVGITRGVLEHLGLAAIAVNDIAADESKQADSVNAEWIARYRAAQFSVAAHAPT